MTAPPRKRVLFVAYYFPPRGGAGVQRSLKFVKYLRRFGWEPTVLTTQYPRRSTAYDETLLAEIPEGTKVVTVPSKEGLFVGLSKSGLGRLTGLFARPDALVGWAKSAAAVAADLHAERPFDAVYTSVQPWSAGLVGLRLKQRLGVPWVSDFRDPWTRSLHLEWPSRFHWHLDKKIESRYLHTADRTLVVTPTMRDEFLADHPEISPEHVRVIHNGFDVDDFEAPGAPGDGKFTIVFTGKFQYDDGAKDEGGLKAFLRDLLTYKPRGVVLDTHSPVYLFAALAKLFERRSECRAEVRCVFAGTIGEGNMAAADRMGLGNVIESPGYLPHGESVALVKSADALFLPMFSTNDASERVAYASGKIFEYIAAGKPILAATQEGDAKDLTLESGLGTVVAPRDVDGLASAVERLFDDRRSGKTPRADESFVARFTRENLTRELAAVLDEVSAGEARR